MFLWAGSLPDPVRTAQGGTSFTSADDSEAAVTCGLRSSPLPILQQSPSSLLPLMVSESCSKESTARHCIGLPDIPHFSFEVPIDVHWVSPNVWTSRSPCRQESRRRGGDTQWGGWANPSSYLEGISRADGQQKCSRELALRQPQGMTDGQHLLGHAGNWGGKGLGSLGILNRYEDRGCTNEGVMCEHREGRVGVD